MEGKIMFAELIDGVTIEMLNDPFVRIVSDTGIFLITKESNISNYPDLEFEEADVEALETYRITF